MVATRIYLQYEPRLYSDLIQQLFQSIGQEVIVGISRGEDYPVHLITTEQDCGEIVLLSLEDAEEPPGDQLVNLMPHAKVIAFSPHGKTGYKRLPGETSWEELRPFGLAELMNEVLSESNQNNKENV